MFALKPILCTSASKENENADNTQQRNMTHHPVIRRVTWSTSGFAHSVDDCIRAFQIFHFDEKDFVIWRNNTSISGCHRTVCSCLPNRIRSSPVLNDWWQWQWKVRNLPIVFTWRCSIETRTLDVCIAICKSSATRHNICRWTWSQKDSLEPKEGVFSPLPNHRSLGKPTAKSSRRVIKVDTFLISVAYILYEQWWKEYMQECSPYDTASHNCTICIQILI